MIPLLKTDSSVGQIQRSSDQIENCYAARGIRSRDRPLDLSPQRY